MIPVHTHVVSSWIIIQWCCVGLLHCVANAEEYGHAYQRSLPPTISFCETHLYTTEILLRSPYRHNTFQTLLKPRNTFIIQTPFIQCFQAGRTRDQTAPQYHYQFVSLIEDSNTESGAAVGSITADKPAFPVRKKRRVAGWTVFIHPRLLESDPKATEKAIDLLHQQLKEIIHAVPTHAVQELQKVPLYFSPVYPDTRPRAEYHPGAQWLRTHGRDPSMEKAIEFSNIPIFEAETRRMPNFALHELAHAYHDRVLPNGHKNEDVRIAFERAKATGNYERVERQDSEGRKRFGRAYALTNPQEYFAETTEAFFSRNDFFPYCRNELEAHDPYACQVLARLWGCDAAQ